MAFLFCLTYSLGGRLGKCAWEYPDGERCIIELSDDRTMCTDHRILTQMKKDKNKEAARCLMKGRKKNKGIWYIKHNGPEARYPEAMIKWIHRKRQGE